eukprot:2817325-Alexandrium_andersonii.AAC.1
MSASLVGSEMCIRDRPLSSTSVQPASVPTTRSDGRPWRAKAAGWLFAVAQSAALRKSRRIVTRS